MRFQRQPITPTSQELESAPPNAVDQVQAEAHGNVSSPYLLAERLDYNLVRQSAYSYGAEGHNAPVRQVWQPVEEFFATDSADHLDARIEKSFFDAHQIARDGEKLPHRMHAQMFLANLDLLALRGHKRPIEADDIQRSYHMMANVLAENIDQYGKSGLVRRIIAQMVTYALIARAGDTTNIPYIASPREAKSSQSRQNHNLYTLDGALTTKTAMRVYANGQNTPSGRASEQRSYVHYSEGFLSSIGAALEGMNMYRAANPDKTNNQVVAELIANEPYDGYASDSPESTILTTFSGSLIARLNNHRRRVLGLAMPSKTAGAAMRGIARATAVKRPRPGQSRTRARPTGTFAMKYYGKSFTNPYLQAENIPPEVLDRQVMYVGEHIKSLWKGIELGLATRDTESITAAREEARNIADDKNCNGEIRVNAAMIAAASELFVQRVGLGLTTRKDILQSFHNMARVLSDMQQNRYGLLASNHYIGLRAELINYCLVAYCANERYVPYLGSSREERSPLFFANHDMYTLPNIADKSAASKTAAQIKNAYHAKTHKQFGTPDKPRHTFMFPIYTTEVLQRQADQMGLTSKRRRGIDEATRLVVRAMHDTLSDQQTLYLQGFSGSILRLFTDHQEYLRTNSKFHRMPYTTAASPKEYIANL